MDKKYELLLDNKIEYEGKILYRIKALKDFRDITGFIINAGELGGYIESENNLSQEDGSWVCCNSHVCGDAIIRDSIIKDSVIKDSHICEAVIFDSDIEYSTIQNSHISYSNVYKSDICESHTENSHIEDLTIKNSYICKSNIKNSNIKNSYIKKSNIEKSNIKKSNIKFANIENSELTKAIIKNNVTIVDGNLTGKITMPFKDIFQYQCRNRLLTAILTEDDKILYTIGCKHNITEEEFIDLIYNENGGLDENPHREEYLKLIPAIELYFKGE